MLEALLGNKTKEKVLFSLLIRKEAYARNIASVFGLNLLPVQNQFKNMEKAGIVISRQKGRTRLYSFNPRYPFLVELKALLSKALSFVPEKEAGAYLLGRQRPRRQGKPF